MFRNFRSFLSYSQVPVRIAAQQEKHRLYRVRFVPKGKRLNAFLRSFLVLSGFHVTANIMLQTFASEWEEPLFIPLGFVEKGPQKRYQASDPEFQAFLKFSRDKKKLSAARAKVLETLVVLLEKGNRAKFGGNVKAEGSILYFQYPAGPPPEYKRNGLQISPAPRDEAALNSVLHPLRLSTLKYEWISRPISQNTMHRLSNALYPSWVFYSLYLSVATNTLDWLHTLRDNSHRVDSMGDLVAVGTTAVKQGLGDTQSMLRKTWKMPPPPKGHVIIDGIVQVTGSDLVVGIDIMVSFNPETLDDLQFHRAKVRFAGKIRREPPALVQPKSAVEVEEQSKDIIGDTIQATVELQRQGKGFVEKEANISEHQEQKIREKEPEDAKPMVRILAEKREAQIPDSSPSEAVGKSGRNKEREADADDAASPKS